MNKTSGPTAGGALQTLRFSSRASSLVSAHVQLGLQFVVVACSPRLFYAMRSKRNASASSNVV